MFADGAAACAYATTDYRGRVSGQDVRLHGLRLSLTLEHHDHAWRIVQAHWSIPADGSLLNPGPPAHARGTTAGGFPSGAAAAFTVYQQLAASVTERLNQGTFDFAADIAPHAGEQFIEIADGAPLDLAQVKETFAPVIGAIAAGASFSWSVQLEHACDLAPDIVLLVTNARVSLRPSEDSPDSKRYRITNLLIRNASGAWVFIHQHRTEIPTE